MLSMLKFSTRDIWEYDVKDPKVVPDSWGMA